MNKWKRISMLSVIVALVCGSALQAGSIWLRSSRRTRELFTDDIARDVGDILTIIVNEKSKIETATNRGMDKSTARSGETSGSIDFKTLESWFPKALQTELFKFPELKFNSKSNQQYDGAVDYDTDRSMTDQITVVVEDVQPNGNLVILGRRTRTIAGDSQIIEISGIVRPSDITFSNTVASSRVADFHVVHRTEGRENRFIRPGWMERFFNIINPF